MTENYEKIDQVSIDSLHKDFHVNNVIDYIHDGISQLDRNYSLELHKKFEKQRWQVHHF